MLEFLEISLKQYFMKIMFIAELEKIVVFCSVLWSLHLQNLRYDKNLIISDMCLKFANISILIKIGPSYFIT